MLMFLASVEGLDWEQDLCFKNFECVKSLKVQRIVITRKSLITLLYEKVYGLLIILPCLLVAT